MSNEQHLLDFHLSHIGGACPVKHIHNELIERQERYPDGTIRTLSDEQIAFFRASELRQKQRQNEQAKIDQQKTEVTNSVSAEETQPGTPISTNKSSYDLSYGKYKDYILQLETNNDRQFIELCRKYKVRDYYPVLPRR